MRHRTAGILSAVLIGGMFLFPAVIKAIFLPSLERGYPDPVPLYEQVLLSASEMCLHWRWILPVPIVVVLFAVSGITSQKYNPHASTLPPTNEPPALWNPNAAALWSGFFSPAFGAFLHARNADAMGRVKEAEANRLFFYLSIVYLGVALTPIRIPTGTSFGLLFVWYLVLGKNQAAYVKQEWGHGYQRKPWKTPLLIASCCLLGAIVVMVVADKLALGLR